MDIEIQNFYSDGIHIFIWHPKSRNEYILCEQYQFRKIGLAPEVLIIFS